MAEINPDGYFNHLKAYLCLTGKQNEKHYGTLCKASEMRNVLDDEIVLADNDDTTKERLKAKLGFSGRVMGIKLDAFQDKLFHFLNNDKHPWGKRCDFVVFQSFNDNLKAYCIEFKKARTYIPAVDVALQLNAGEAWCCTLHSLISNYIGKTSQLSISKFLFTDCENPQADLDDTGRYLRNYPDIRHYRFSDLANMRLEELENEVERRLR